MEDSQYNTLKSSLSTVPAKALNYSCRIILSRNLDIKQLLTSKKGHARDYRGFAELMGFQYSETKKFEKFDDPTLKILEAWETNSDATLDKLIDFLEEMERYDVIEAIIPSIEKDAIAFKQSRQNLSLQEIPIQVPEVSSCPASICFEKEILTRDDLLTGESTIYDVYVSYADTSEEDSRFVKKLADLLESPDIGLKLYIHGRDMLAGSSELETNIEMIKNRCKRMLIVLTNDFIRSPQCAFQIRFAASLSIEQKERMLVPVRLSQCEIPSVLLTVSRIDFTNPTVYQWMWEKLIVSLLPKGKYPRFLQSCCELPHETSLSANLESVSNNNNNHPVITYPETVKQLALPLDKTPDASSLVKIPDECPSSKISTANLESVSNNNNNNNPVITYPETVKQLALPLDKTPNASPLVEIPDECPSSKISTEVMEITSVEKGASEMNTVKASATVPSNVEIINKSAQTPPTSRAKSWKNKFSSYLRKGRSSSSSSSVLSSGYCSESTSSDNLKCINE